MSWCARCGRKLETVNIWLRLGRGTGRLSTRRFELCNVCGEFLESVILTQRPKA